VPSERPTPWYFEECDRVVEFESGDVEPCEIGRFHRAEGDAGDLFFEELGDELVVAAQIGDQCLAPRFAVVVGGFAAGIAEAIHFGDDAADRFLKLESQLGVFDDREGTCEAGQVVGLTWCHECHGARGERLAEFGSDDVLRVVVKDEVAVDLVGDEDQVVLFAEVAEACEFCFCVNTADGIVRAAQDEELGVRLDGGFHCIEVERPCVVSVEAERDFNKLTVGVVGRAEEGRVDGRCRHDGFVGCDEGMAAEVDRGHEAGQEVEPVGFGAVAVLAVEIVEHRLHGCFVGYRVAEDAVV